MKLVSQDYYVLDNHTVEENIKDMLSGFSEEYKTKRSKTILNVLELTLLKNLKSKNLSSGQKQRVAIARALAVFPKLLLLDEPFSNLDKILKDKLFDFIIKQAKKKKTSVILVTHHADEALKYADKIAVIENGKILQSGIKEKVYYQPKNLKVAKLLGDYNIISHKDFEKNSQWYKKNKKILLRPNLFFTSQNKKNYDLSATYLTHFFNGKCYEVLAQTKSKTEFVFYTAQKPDFEINLYLSVVEF